MKKIDCIMVLLFIVAHLLPAQEITPAGTPAPTPTPTPLFTCSPCVLHAVGHVITTSNYPIQGAKVSMTTAENGTVTAETDSAGYYELLQATCGCGSDADFYVSREGFISLHEVHYVGSDKTTIDFTLESSSNAGKARFVPQAKKHLMLNLIFFNEGIPAEITLVPLSIIGDFTFTNEVHVNTGDQVLAVYDMTINFDPSVVIINTAEGENGVSSDLEGFVTVVNTSNPGVISVSGFDVTGFGPSSDLHLYTIHWFAQTYNGTTQLIMNVDSLLDDNSTQVGIPSAQNGSITIETITCVLGDVNNDSSIDIVDALLLAQYYVGLNPSMIDITCGDVNCDGVINIIDALLIAQYFVGLITEFC